MKLSDTIPDLRSFPDRAQPSAHAFGAKLSDPSVRRVVAYCDPETAEGALIYGRIIGIGAKLRIQVVQNGVLPSEAALAGTSGAVPLIVERAVNPALKDRFFQNADPRVHHFVDHHYQQVADHESPELLTIGTTASGLDIVDGINVRGTVDEMVWQRSGAIKRVLGPGTFTPFDMRRVLRSASAARVPKHPLGPAGTNNAQATGQ